MIKKYFAMSIIAASVALTACSDDDDDEPAPTPTVNPGDPDPTVPVAPAATPGEGNTALDFVVNSPDHTELERLVIAAGLADTLDDPAAQFTIFAPTDLAFAALPEGTVTGLEEDTDALARVLKQHVLEGSVQSDEITSGVSAVADGEAPFSVVTLASGAPAQSLTFTANVVDDGILYDITDGSGNVVPLTGPLDQNVSTEVGAPTTGVVHVIENVLLPVAADPVVETPDETENPDGTENPDVTPAAGGVDAALTDLGGFEIFRTSVARDFAGTLDTNQWTVFVPSDATLSAAGVSDLTAAQQQAHIVSSSALTPGALATTESVVSSGDPANTYAVAADGSGGVTVDGKAVSLIATGEGGAQIYSIDGILGAPAAP